MCSGPSGFRGTDASRGGRGYPKQTEVPGGRRRRDASADLPGVLALDLGLPALGVPVRPRGPESLAVKRVGSRATLPTLLPAFRAVADSEQCRQNKGITYGASLRLSLCPALRFSVAGLWKPDFAARGAGKK